MRAPRRRRRRRPALSLASPLLLAVLSPACLPGELAADLEIACAGDDDCPGGLSCVVELGRCFGAGSACVAAAAGGGFAPLPDGTPCEADGVEGDGVCIRAVCAASSCGDGFVDAVVAGEECDDGAANSDVGSAAPADVCRTSCTLGGCGDGILDVNEECDDGNTAPDDGCSERCTNSCGDGDLQAGEGCDDGNAADGDGCDTNCTPSGCGNGVVAGGEECDDGDLEDGDGCDAVCRPTGCGNGHVTAGEECDDGNDVDEDGCAVGCVVNPCGNGRVGAGELCDDGDDNDGDGCDSNCRPTGCGNGVLTLGEQCDDGNLVDGDLCDSNCRPTGCGNGLVTAGEVCDDGNVVDNDGCDGNCTPTACGNGVQTLGEECDDGDVEDNDGCDGNCTVTGCGNGVVNLGETCDDGDGVLFDACPDGPSGGCLVAFCGDGVRQQIDGQEACDDGNQVNGDGCDTTCTPSGCGNGQLAPTEECDDGNLVDDDGCDSNCTEPACGNGITNLVVAPPGVPLAEGCDDGNGVEGDGCDSNCTLTGCGNGIVTSGEACDDGDAQGGDGCDPNCTVTACGNGFVSAGEACDDGNLVDADACRATCVINVCGDGARNADPGSAGFEACDDGNTLDPVTLPAAGDPVPDYCSSTCSVLGDCGDGVLQPFEECDDPAGPGCADDCTVEDGFGCRGRVCFPVVYVSPLGNDGAAGDHWERAFLTVARGRQRAQELGGAELWLRAGTYRPDQGPGTTAESRAATFALGGGAVVVGGFFGDERNADRRHGAASVLDGQLTTVRTEAVVTIQLANGTAALLDGVTVTRGGAQDNPGGGVRVFGPTGFGQLAQVVLRDVRVVDNQADDGAGGIRVSNQAQLLCVDCAIEDNTGNSSGGGVGAGAGAAVTFVRGRIAGNVTGDGDGGGASVAQGTFVGTVFDGNTADGGGFNAGEGGALTGNALVVVGCLFVRNLSGGDGSAIFATGNVDIRSSTFAFNDGGVTVLSAGAASTVRHAILWDNINGTFSTPDLQLSATGVVQHSIVERGVTAGQNGNLVQDPLLDADGRLGAGSPAIDAGDNALLGVDTGDLNGDGNTAEPLPLDIDGQARVQGGTVDIGADERQ